MAIVGGGVGSLIGPVHCAAARLDGAIEIVASALSGDPVKSTQAGRALGIARPYPSFAQMLAGEQGQAEGADFVTIATPNHLHASMTRDALAADLHVFCDKPATASGAEMLALAPVIASSKKVYAVAHTYSGYPMVRQARKMCQEGDLGEVRSIEVQYHQGWLAEPIERYGHKQATWRADPQLAGVGGCISDIGVHAFHLAEFVSGIAVVELYADLLHAVPGRQLDDGCNLLLRLANGAKGTLIASQIATGARNDLRLRVHGSKASLSWEQERPDRLTVNAIAGPELTHFAGGERLYDTSRAASRLPPGHPEGFIEALANLYRDFSSKIAGEPRDSLPGLDAAVRGMAFIETAIESDRRQSWTALDAGLTGGLR
jgi:predicted dehydrogenase